MRAADERRNASIMTVSSTRWSLTVPDSVAHVGWTTNTSVPRMFSSIWNEISESGNRRSRACPGDTPRKSAISRASAGWALPEKTFSSPKPGAMIGSPITTNASRVGWGGRIRTFEYGIQSPAPYRLATPHRVPFQCPSAAVSADLQEWPPLRGANGKCIRWAYLAARPGLARRQAARESVRVTSVRGHTPPRSREPPESRRICARTGRIPLSRCRTWPHGTRRHGAGPSRSARSRGDVSRRVFGGHCV